MANITVTAANVTPGASAGKQTGNAGETITAGMAVYLNASNLWMKALASGTLIQSGSGTSYGIALCGSSLNQPITVDTFDLDGISIGGTTTAGVCYVVSATAGLICPIADIVTSGYYITILGVGKAGNKIQFVSSGNTGLQIP